MECYGVWVYFKEPSSKTTIILDKGDIKISWGEIYILKIKEGNNRNIELYKTLKSLRDEVIEDTPSHNFLNSVVSYLSELIADEHILNNHKNISIQTDISISDKKSFKEILYGKNTISTQTTSEVDDREKLNKEFTVIKEEYSKLKNEYKNTQQKYDLENKKMKKSLEKSKKSLEKANNIITTKDKALKNKNSYEKTSDIFKKMIEMHNFNYVDLSYIMLESNPTESIKTLVIWQLFYTRSLAKEDLRVNNITKVGNFFDLWMYEIVPILEKIKQQQIKDMIGEWKEMMILITREDAKVEVSNIDLNQIFWCICHRFKYRCQVKSFYPPFFTMLSEMCLNLEKLNELVCFWENNKTSTPIIVKEIVKLFMYNTHFNLLAKYSEKLDKKDLEAIFHTPKFLVE